MSLADVGFSEEVPESDGPTVDGMQYPESVGQSIQVLSGVTEADQQGRDLGIETSEDAPSIITSYLLTQQLAVVSGVPAGGKRGLAAPIRDTTASFMQLDFQHGGGHLRNLLLSFFRDTVIPKLREEHPEEERVPPRTQSATGKS